MDIPASQEAFSGLPPPPEVPSVFEDSPLLRSHTYQSPIPADCLPSSGSAFAQVLKGKPCALGVDEAGRGPVLGPLVYGVAVCPVDAQDKLKEIGFADSKALTAERRDALLKALIQNNEILSWATTSISPLDISKGMTRRRPINLNTQSTAATIGLIEGFLAAGVDVTEIYVDTVGDPDTYKRVLSSSFPRHKHIQWTVCSKADAIYPIVGAASIAAKVTRDRWIEGWKYAEVGLGESHDNVIEATADDEKSPHHHVEPLLETQAKSPGKKRTKAASSVSPRKRQKIHTVERIAPSSPGFWRMGSGYPGDPETQKYLIRTLDPVFGWPCIVRFSWQTAKTMMEEKLAGRTQRPSRGTENGEGSLPEDVSPYGTRSSSQTRCHPIHWIDEPAKITNFFQKAAMQSQQKSSARSSDFAARHKKARTGLAKDLSIQSIGPDGL